MKIVNKLSNPTSEIKTTFYYLIDPDTGEIIDYVDKQFYNSIQYKRNKDLQPNEEF